MSCQLNFCKIYPNAHLFKLQKLFIDAISACVLSRLDFRCNFKVLFDNEK